MITDAYKITIDIEKIKEVEKNYKEMGLDLIEEAKKQIEDSIKFALLQP